MAARGEPVSFAYLIAILSVNLVHLENGDNAKFPNHCCENRTDILRRCCQTQEK